MAEAVSKLIEKLGPLRSPHARTVLWVLAHKADESGECGVIALSELSRLTQIPRDSISEILNSLEDDYLLVQKIERGPSEASAFRLSLERLSSPYAHVKQDTQTFKAVLGPAAGQRFPVPDIPKDECDAVVTNTTGKLNVPLIYHLTSSGCHPVFMTHTADGVPHVYRLSSRTWRYTGVSVEVLKNYGVGQMSIKRLKDADILTMQELSHTIHAWNTYRNGNNDPDAFGPAILDKAYRGRNRVAPRERTLKRQGAAAVLAAHQAWLADETGPHMSQHAAPSTSR